MFMFPRIELTFCSQILATALIFAGADALAGAAVSNTQKCVSSYKQRKDMWKACAFSVRESSKLNDLLTEPEVIKEINSFPDRLTAFTANYEEQLRFTKFYVISELLRVDSRFDPSIYGFRFAVELYKTMDGAPAICKYQDGFEICLGSKHMAKVLLDQWVPPTDYDLSTVQANRHVFEYFRQISRSGYLDKSDSPASLKVASYPPPLVPEWSERYEPERTAAVGATQVVAPTSMPPVIRSNDQQPQPEQSEGQEPSGDKAATQLAAVPASSTPWGAVAMVVFVLATIGVGALLLRRRKGSSG